MTNMVSRLLRVASNCSGTEHQALNYADYCVALCEKGHQVKPISKAQWDSLCSIKGNRDIIYVSTTECAIRNAEAAYTKE